jgi:hypothetical protein
VPLIRFGVQVYFLTKNNKNMSKFKIRIWQDTDNSCPLSDWDWSFGISLKDYLEKGSEYGIDFQDEVVLHKFPVYRYEHSGTSVSLEPFFCKWDSGQWGYLTITKSSMEEMGWKNLTEKRIEHFRKQAEAMIEVFNQYLSGEVYGFTIESEVDSEGFFCDDSCGGFYGDILKSGMIDHIEIEGFADAELTKVLEYIVINEWINENVLVIKDEEVSPLLLSFAKVINLNE